MTAAELLLLKESVDQVVSLQIADRTVLAQVLFVFDEGETPDIFYIEMKRTSDRCLIPVGLTGHSTLLSEIAGVLPVPED